MPRRDPCRAPLAGQIEPEAVERHAGLRRHGGDGVAFTGAGMDGIGDHRDARGDEPAARRRISR